MISEMVPNTPIPEASMIEEAPTPEEQMTQALVYRTRALLRKYGLPQEHPNYHIMVISNEPGKSSIKKAIFLNTPPVVITIDGKPQKVQLTEELKQDPAEGITHKAISLKKYSDAGPKTIFRLNTDKYMQPHFTYMQNDTPHGSANEIVILFNQTMSYIDKTVLALAQNAAHATRASPKCPDD